MTSPLNLVKLCVGVETPEELEEHINIRQNRAISNNQPFEQFHTTRMVPKRMDELMNNGSLYWVIKGVIQCRQKLLEIRPFVGEDGIRRCHLVLEPKLILTHHHPKRPFQGWRYLKSSDAPKDLTGGKDEIPALLHRELAELGLL